MQIAAERIEFAEIEQMRELYRAEAQCQIVHDSALRRVIADSYLLLCDGRRAGYAGVWNKHYPGRIMEFYSLPHYQPYERQMVQAVVSASGATHIEAQTNMPIMLRLLYDFAQELTIENILFADARITSLQCPDGVFRKSEPGDEKDAREWVVEAAGNIAAWGGVLFHYNPPYGDIYMEVALEQRRKGYGSYLVQELKRVCYEGGHMPAARCNPDNAASRATLEKAGFEVCGRMLSGTIRSEYTAGLTPG